jgi:hypothetical protein
MAKWLYAIRQTTTYLGVAVIAIIWSGIYLLANEEHKSSYDDAVSQGNNLTRVLEEYIRRVVQDSDNALLSLRLSYQNNPEHFDLSSWAAKTQSNNDLAMEFGVVDSNGFVTSRGQNRPALYQRAGSRTYNRSVVA